MSVIERNFAVVAVTGIVVLGAVGLYVMNVRPELPLPATFAHIRAMQNPSAVEKLAAATQILRSTRETPVQAQMSLGSVDEMVERLATRLKQNPNNPEGWRMLGWSYLKTERFGGAVAAYAKAVELNPDTASLRSSLGEALVKAAKGQVTAEAKRVFEYALTLDPQDPAARYYAALAKAQAGDKIAAVGDWTALLSDANPREPWVAEVMQTATEFGREIGIDVPGRLRRTHAAKSDGILELLRERADQVSHEIEKGPTAEDVRNADGTPPVDQSTMIQNMVVSFAARLDKSPRDVEGWIKLIRSRTVLGETEAARQAFDLALKIFSDASQERDQIAAAGRQFGLTQ